MPEPSNERPVRVRVAPSPTGDPHVGTAYIALFNYVFAKANKGSFVLRIEDTDRQRYRSSSQAAIIDSLRWVGLDWDEGPDVGGEFGPYCQSERTEHYQSASKTLLEKGAAYRCFCSAERLTEVREAQKAAKTNTRYDKHCLGLSAEASRSRADAGEAFVIRLDVPTTGEVTFADRLRGTVTIAATQLDDQVLLKSDGFPTYHLANVVDDHHMNISHVIRAEEWISSTPKHVLLYRAFGWQEPEWIHMPLLRNADKSKISKRKNPVSINYYKDIGILPEALVNFLGVMGWSMPDDQEIFSLSDMVKTFNWDRVSLGGPVFDQDKLRWVNEQYIHGLSYEDLADRLIEWNLSKEKLTRVLPLMRERITSLSDFVPATLWLYQGDMDLDPIWDKIVIPELSAKEVAKTLAELIESYDAIDDWTYDALKTASKAFCDANGHKPKHVFMLLRYLTTGTKASPPLFETMEVIGKELCRRRLRCAVDRLKKQK